MTIPPSTLSIPYEKWDATGNDFVLVDLARCPIDEERFTPDLVKAICARDSGVGADGVVLLRRPPRSEGAACRMAIWNSNGSPAAMCGNALRCVAMVLARDAPEVMPWPVQIGERIVETRVQDPSRATVSMGPVAAVESAQHHPEYSSLDGLDQVLEGRGYLLSFGNPHYVVPCREIPEGWAELGARVQPVAHRLLGLGGINCGFLQSQPHADGTFSLRVYERGVGVTKSCGSGACAASAVLQNRLGVQPPHRLEVLGGLLEIGRSANGAGYTLTGPARMEFQGHWSPQ